MVEGVKSLLWAQAHDTKKNLKHRVLFKLSILLSKNNFQYLHLM